MVGVWFILVRIYSGCLVSGLKQEGRKESQWLQLGIKRSTGSRVFLELEYHAVGRKKPRGISGLFTVIAGVQLIGFAAREYVHLAVGEMPLTT